MTEKDDRLPEQGGLSDRRTFVKQGALLALSGLAGLPLVAGCKGKQEEGEGQKVSPPEDLMQEHGLLNRILLVYDHCRARLAAREDFPKEALFKAATIVRTFVEDYHEKQEEQYLFPRFQKANQLTGLVSVLLQQHQAGRQLTDRILQLSKAPGGTDADAQALTGLLDSFNRMYRPHEAREDTVLFPAFRKIVSRHEYDSLGEEFEKNEHKRFGQDGFDRMVDQVAAIEKTLGIYELAQFTPREP